MYAIRSYYADTLKPIRIEPTGERIKPEESTARLRAEYKTGEIEIFDASPETLQEDMDRAFGEDAKLQNKEN